MLSKYLNSLLQNIAECGRTDRRTDGRTEETHYTAYTRWPHNEEAASSLEFGRHDEIAAGHDVLIDG